MTFDVSAVGLPAADPALVNREREDRRARCLQTFASVGVDDRWYLEDSTMTDVDPVASAVRA